MSGRTYLQEFSNKRLNQVVIPGSHDAGIYLLANSDSGKTQDLDIKGQAAAGCRWFDIRVTGHVTRNNGQVTNIEHRAFHSAFKKTKSINNTDVLDRTMFTDFGGKLPNMLAQARNFVQSNPSEFLIFKISKSNNIDHVYDTCVEVLGDYHYKRTGLVDLNTQKVGDLAGKVITLFSKKDINGISKRRTSGGLQGPGTYYDGLFPYVELMDKDKNIVSYEQFARGLQYFGKYSNERKLVPSAQKQTKRTKKYLSSQAIDHRAMGVMYWTLTTQKNLSAMWDKDIETRNQKLWVQNGVKKLYGVFGKAIIDCVASHMGPNALQGEGRHDWTLFTPNVVMIDFVDSQKCAQIKELNSLQNHIIEGAIERYMWSPWAN